MQKRIDNGEKITRKGQLQLLEKVQRHGYSQVFIEQLSRQDLTLPELKRLYWLFYGLEKKSDKWARTFVKIDDDELKAFICKYRDDITDDIIVEIDSRAKLFAYLSHDNVICGSLCDAEVLMTVGQHKHAGALLDLSHKIESNFLKFSNDECRLRDNISVFTKELSDMLNVMEDCSEFLNNIDINALCSSFNYYIINEDYFKEYVNVYALAHAPFVIENSKGIPDEIWAMNFHGLKVSIDISGLSRTVNYNISGVYITYSPYNSINVSKGGNLSVNQVKTMAKRLVYVNSTQEFITGYQVKGKYRYKPASLRELFTAISIGGGKDGGNVIEFLCNKYKTLIFKDLYADYLASNGFLPPLLITEAACYHTKKELFRKHYNLTVNGNWNKKNANLSYLILKLKNRMTDEAFARAMQCKTPPEVQKVGTNRYVLAYILYCAVYNINEQDFSRRYLLLDALREEYDNKKITLETEAQIVNRHNMNQMQSNDKPAKPFEISSNTKFKSLISNMPKSFELITTPERLSKEAVWQHNCVNGYSDKIGKDICMIYSVIYDNRRHTVEIGREDGIYVLRQCYKACNTAPDWRLLEELKDILIKINAGIAS